MIAKFCEMEFEFRHLPEHCSDGFLEQLETFLHREVRSEMRALDQDAGAEIQTLSHVPAFKAAADSRLLRVLQAASGTTETGYWDGVTEAGLYAEIGLDTIVCGPGSLSQAHQPDEAMEEQDLAGCYKMLRSVAAELAG
jgi:acetylornithine deacetylase